MAEGKTETGQVLIALGRIEGELKGIRELVRTTSHATNQRIDDLSSSVNTRIEDHQENTDKQIKAVNRQAAKKGAASGGLGGAAITGLVELIRALAER